MPTGWARFRASSGWPTVRPSRRATGADVSPPGQAQVGAAIGARVSYTDGFGTPESLTSAATGAVAAGAERFGSPGPDSLSGGAGDDVLRGGLGADTFVFRLGSGTDRVVDFGTVDAVAREAALLGGGTPTRRICGTFPRSTPTASCCSISEMATRSPSPVSPMPAPSSTM